MVGERRVVTILFCDVKGSTAAAEQLDPEDWTEIMNGAFEHMIAPVYQYEGTVARMMGDSVLAFFGAPVAHEDDPQRAVLAGLGILDGMGGYRDQIMRAWGLDFDVRVGINTGLVVVGAVGSDLRMEYTAMGDAINLAARMEQTAAPGTVQISQDTYERVATLFECESLGEVQVKGKSEPVRAYRVLGRATTPFRRRGVEGLAAPLVGRAAERRALDQAVSGLEKGLGGIVFLVGEAGLGKSRMIGETRLSAPKASSMAWFETLSLSYETHRPYGLFRRLSRRLIGALPDERPEGMREKIGHMVEEVHEGERSGAQRVFESLFGLAGKDGEPPLEGESFKGLFYTVMTSFWQRRAESGPVVLVCDDLHWSDPASLDLLQNLYPVTEEAALVLICAMRPERGAPGWKAMKTAEREFPHRFREVRLRPLSAGESGELVDKLLRISDFPDSLRRRILEKSEGNPYFVEEVVRTLIDQGVVVRDQRGSRWRATGGGEDLDIPGNLQALLVARMDRLNEEARRTLQIASIVGRSFYYRVLRRLIDVTVDELDRQLLTLLHSQLIREAAREPEREYMFRHALTQEAAYSTLLLRQRRDFHLAVGEAMEALYPDRRQEMAGTLADHYFNGRDFEKALQYATLAGDEAFRLHAAREALSHYEHAIQCAAQAEASDEVLVHLYTRRGRAFELDSQFDRALENYQLMGRLADQGGSDRLKLASLAAQCVLHATQTPLYDPSKARVHAEQALDLARQIGDRAVEAKILWGMLLVEAWGEGDPEKALAYGTRSLDLAQALGLKEQMGFTLTNLVNAYMLVNDLNAAREANLKAQQIWRDLDNLPMLADSYTMRQDIEQKSGQFDAALSTAKKGLQLSESIGNLWNQMTSLTYLSWIHADQGDVKRALEANADHLRLSEEAGFFQNDNLIRRLSIYVNLGALNKAAPVAERLHDRLDEIIHFFRPEVVFLIVLVKIGCGDLDQAASVLEEAVEGFDLAGSPFFTAYLALARIRLDLERGDPQRALEGADRLVGRLRQAGFRQLLPRALWHQARAWRQLGQPSRAAPILLEALTICQEMVERMMRWRILVDLAELEARRGNATDAQKWRRQARQVIAYISDHTPPDLREDFLARPEVRAVLE
jgi:class 3 adenylate cyclase/tetratricopeptide (TPR) repeat protein